MDRSLCRILAAGCTALLLGTSPATGAPDVFITNTFTDTGAYFTGSGSGNVGDLRYCLARSNASTNPEGSIIYLQNADPSLAQPLPPITRTVTITSFYAEFNAAINANFTGRLFFIDAPASHVVTVRRVNLTNGYAKGGNGGPSGGGGAGLGGAFFVNSGQLVVDSVNFGSFGAEGGRGGDFNSLYAGGGGGLGGDGGVNGGGGGGFGGAGGNGSNTNLTGNAGGGGGGIAGRGGAGVSPLSGGAAGGGGGGTVNANGANGQGGGGSGGFPSGGDGSLYGGGAGATPSNGASTRGGTGGKFGGGGGGAGGPGYALSLGGQGGDFGGGGGSFHSGGSGGYGGGGGGGGANVSSVGGLGGFGGGHGGGFNQGGNGGSAYGALIFVRGSNGAGPVTIQENGLPVGSLTAGAGGNSNAQATGTAGLTGGTTIFHEAIGSTPPDLIFDTASDRTIAGTISSSSNGTILLRKRGAGRLIFQTPQSYSGFTILEAGGLQLAPSGGNLGDSLAVVDGTLDLHGNSITLRGLGSAGGNGVITSTVPGNVTVTLDSNGLTTDFGGGLIDPAAGGTLSLVKTGTSVQGMLGQSPFTGGTTVNAGQLRTGAPNTPFGAIGRGSVTIGGTGEILVLGSNAFMGFASSNTRTVRINAGGTLRAASGASSHLVPVILAGGTLAATDPDPTFGSWNFDYGLSTPGGGSVSTITGGNATLAQVDGTVFQIGNGDTVNVSTVLASLPGLPGTALRKTGPGTLVLSGLNTFTAGTSLEAGKLTLSAGGAVGAIRGALTIASGTTLEATAANAFGFSPNTKVDSVTLNGGTLLNASTADLGWGVAYTLNGGTMSSNGGVASATATSKWAFGGNAGGPTSVLAKQNSTSTIAGRIDLRSDQGITGTVFTTETNATLHVTAAITTSAASQFLTKSGPGTLTLSGPNTYAGETVLNAGVLGLASNTALGASKLRFMGGTLRFVGVNADISPNINLAGTGGFFVDTNSQNVTFATALTGSAGLTKSGAGTLTLSGANAYSGTTSLVGGELGLAHASALGSSRLTFNGGTLKYIGLNPDLSALFNAGGSGPIAIDTNGQDVTFASALSNPNGLSKAGAGRLTLGAASPNLAGTTTLAGGSLRLGAADRLGTSRLTFAGGLLEYAGFNTDLSALFNSPSAGTYRIDPGTQTVQLATALGGTGGFTKAGSAETLILSGNNTFTGPVHIQGGVVQVGAGGSTGSLGSPTSLVNDGQLNLVGTVSVNLAVPMSGTGSVTLSGGSSLRVAGANTSTGPITVNSGSTLLVSPGATLFNAGTLPGTVLTLNAGGRLTLLGNDFLGGASSTPQTAVVAQPGARITTFPASGPSFAVFNQLTLNGAELRADNGSNFFSPSYFLKGTVTVGSSVPSTITAQTSPPFGEIVWLGPDTVFDVAVGPAGPGEPHLTVSTRLQDPPSGGLGTLTKTGPGLMLVTAVNTFSGPTRINAGRLALLGGATTGTGAIEIASGAGFHLLALGSAGFTLPGGRALTNHGTILGVLVLGSGTAQYAGDGVIQGGLTVQSEAIFARSSGSVTVTGTLINQGIIRFTHGAVFDGSGLTSLTNDGVIDLITASPASRLPAEFTGNGLVLPPGGVAVKTATRAGNMVTVQIDSFTAHTYQLQRSTNLATDVFVNVGPAQPGTGLTAPGELTFTDASAPAGPVFYRVLVQD